MDILGAVRKWFSGTFSGLSDVPDYSGQGLKLLRINATEDGVEAVASGSGVGTPADTVIAETAYGQSPSGGASTEYSRGDHTHGTPESSVSSHDHSGVAEGTSLVPATLRVPNGAGGTTVDAAGEVCVDTTSKTVNFYDGAAEVVLNPIKQMSFVLIAPVATDDYPLAKMPVAGTLVGVDYVITGATNWVGQIQEGDANGANGVDTQAADSTVTTTNVAVTSFSNAGYDAGDWLLLKSTSISGTPTSLSGTIRYKENP